MTNQHLDTVLSQEASKALDIYVCLESYAKAARTMVDARTAYVNAAKGFQQARIEYENKVKALEEKQS